MTRLIVSRMRFTAQCGRTGMLAALSLLLCCVFVSGCGSGISSFVPAVPAAAPVPGAPAGAILGYVWNGSDGTLRPMLGVVGSSVVGASVVPAGTYVSGTASSASDIGLVEDAAGTLFSLALPTATRTHLADAAPAHAQLVLSPKGGAAVAYAVGGDHVVLLSNLAATPLATSVPMPAGSRIAAASVSDAGTILVATAASPTVVGVLSSAGSLTRVATVGQAGALSFVPGKEDALVADSAASTLALLHSVSGAATVQALPPQGLSSPVGIAVTRDARWAVVANGADTSTVTFDLSNIGTGSRLACACQPATVSALNGGYAFRLNTIENGPVWIADLSGAKPQMYFVPAVH